ncbi:MAG: PQQ-like beta-propeller repeat protein [Bryobacterales bacterium]|nr:PQQ-like beta-propeller repeat protein [Bryobacterales bacterium]
MRWLIAAQCAVWVAAAQSPHNWPQFRGPEALGLGVGTAPMFWNLDPKSGPTRGLKWKTPIPGLSHSSPIIWEDRLYVATAVSSVGEAPLKVGLYGAGDSADDNAEQAWIIYCLDKRTGQVLWERTAHKGRPKAARHTKATHANTTLATDGKRIVAFFGSEGLFAFGMNGKPLWRVDLGNLDAGPLPENLSWGFASSPVLYRDTVVVQADVKSGPFLAAYAAKDGKQVWRTPRGGVSERSWSTPTVIEQGKRSCVVCNGWPFIAGYDWNDGRELWRLGSGGDVPVPTPVYASGLVFVANAHGGPSPLYAIRLNASGDITPKAPAQSSTGVAWMEPRNGAYMQTPLVHSGIVYSASDRGVLNAYDASTGQRYYQQRLSYLAAAFTASPVAAEGRLYFTSEEGDVYVVKEGAAYQYLGISRLGEVTLSTPAISQGTLFFRTRGHVVAITDQ